MKLLAIRLGYQKTITKSVVMSLSNRHDSVHSTGAFALSGLRTFGMLGIALRSPNPTASICIIFCSTLMTTLSECIYFIHQAQHQGVHALFAALDGNI